jgi:hypothetical protein
MTEDFVITFKANTSRRMENILANRTGKAEDIEHFWKMFIKNNLSEFMEVTEVQVQRKADASDVR